MKPIVNFNYTEERGDSERIAFIKRRSLFGRIVRLPKLIKRNWQFSDQMPFFERVRWVFFMVKIILK